MHATQNVSGSDVFTPGKSPLIQRVEIQVPKRTEDNA